MGIGGLMRLWRLSDARFANVFDGGYGLLHEGRWNWVGRPVTYAATSPSLCLLEKLVHVEDPELLPPLVMTAYDVPAKVPIGRRSLAELPTDWRDRETMTQGFGDAWLSAGEQALLFVPSVIMAIDGSPDENVLINHRHPASAAIVIAHQQPFTMDVRLRR